MHFIAEFKGVFHTLFAKYRDVPTDPNGEGERPHGHMTLNAFLRFCGDFGLFPEYANFQTIQWLYYTAQGYVHNPPKLKIPVEITQCGRYQVPVGATRSNRSEGARRRPSVAGDMNKVRSRRTRKTVVETGPKILYCGKWLGPHLQWMTKEPEDATEMERWVASLLGAIDEWLEDARLTVTELFQFVDVDNNGVIDKDEFKLGVDFMDLRSRPTPSQLEAAFGLLVSPGEAVIEILSLEMAIRCSAKRQENLNRAGNIFTKEPLKMTQAEFNACIFFREVSRLLGWKQKTPGELFDEFGKKKKGKLASVSLTQQVHQMIQGMDRGSPVLGIGVCDPFDILDLNQDGVVTKDEFCSVIEKVEESKRLRELNGIEEKHPIFLSARVKPPERSCQWIFGRGAFVECLMKIAFQHLGFHGTSEQKLQPCLSKAIWLLLLLHWQFDTAKGHNSNKKPEDSKAAEVESGEEWDLPKYVTPLRRLLWTHPRLFLDHPTPSGEPRKQSIWDDIGAKADPIVHALLQNGPPRAQGLDSLDRGVLSATAEA
jgi:Ca2+-binding EF-hand superfamily protein